MTIGGIGYYEGTVLPKEPLLRTSGNGGIES